MTTNTARTPGPWRVELTNWGRHPIICGPDRLPICSLASNTTAKNMERVRNGTREANAAFIVRAANSHDELVAALDECVDQLWHLAKDPKNNALIQQARAALAKAQQP